MNGSRPSVTEPEWDRDGMVVVQSDGENGKENGPTGMEEMEERLAVTQPDGGDANDRGLREMEWDEWTKNGVKDGG